MRNALVSLCVLLACSVAPAAAQVSVGIGFPGVNIGINLPIYPELVPVPGYPVYYAPAMSSNYFFYDGMYWVYQADNWYASSWYNGPWGLVEQEEVPLFVLRIPVGYYRQPPPFFIGWQSEEAPRWGEHWGREWNQRHRGWDRWNRSEAPPPAPLPVYQRQYSGDRYPRAEQQPVLRSENDRYQPRDPAVRRQLESQGARGAPASAERGQLGAPRQRNPGSQETRAPNQPPVVQQNAPAQRGQLGEPQQRNPGPQGTRQPTQPPLVQQNVPTQRGQPAEPQQGNPGPQDTQHANAPAQVRQGAPSGPGAQAPQRGNDNAQKSAVTQAPPQTRSPPIQQAQQEAAQRQQAARVPPRQEAAPQARQAPQEQRRAPEPGREKERDKPDDRGQEHK